MVRTMTRDGALERHGSGWPAVVHGGVIGALLAGLAAAWATLALATAMLVTPMETMHLIERHGAWGIRGALRQGSVVLVTALLPETEGAR